MTLVFEAVFALCLSATLALGEVLRKQVNRLLRDGGQAEIGIRWPQSIKETVLGTHLWAFLWELLEQHTKFYPRSSLRKLFVIAIVGILPSFVCLIVGGILGG